MSVELIHGDCLDVMRGMAPAFVDSIVTDPPYGLSFMGKDWDHGVPGKHFWEEALRVAKPGAHLLAFGGTRTFHRLAVAIEDAGWEIRDTLMWVYGSGFPKSHDVSKAIDRAAGAEREVIGEGTTTGARKGSTIDDGKGYTPGRSFQNTEPVVNMITAPATEAAKQWQGWGTNLKPAWEPIVLARKPLSGTVAQNVLAHGTGGLNIDGCRVGADGGTAKADTSRTTGSVHAYGHGLNGGGVVELNTGRWPANIIHDGSPEVLQHFPEGSVTGDRSNASRNAEVSGTNWLAANHRSTEYANDSGSAARFFYTAKTSKSERDGGLRELEARVMRQSSGRASGRSIVDGQWKETGSEPRPVRNIHPTVKPIALMRWLVRMVTPPGGTVVDPFTGSGTTGCACAIEGFHFIGMEKEQEYVAIATARTEHYRRVGQRLRHLREARKRIDPAHVKKAEQASADPCQLSILDQLDAA